jgi:hypothetical protein
VRSIPDILGLIASIGYDGKPSPVNVRDLGIPHLESAHVIRSARTKRAGYGVLVGQANALPRSLRPLARAIQDAVHDQPVALIGVGDGKDWDRLIVLRPRRARGKLGAVTVARLDIDLAHPTGHDAEVVAGLRWRSDLTDEQAQESVAKALDVEAVTNRFYKGLRPHFEQLERAVEADAARSRTKQDAIETAGGVRRMAIRILTQVLFCYFLQRKRLLAGERDYLSRAYSQHSGEYYSTVLEPLFYDTLAVPVDDRKVRTTASIPFLNGGLFAKPYRDVSLDLPDGVFNLDTGLLGYLDHWTFTVAEETADETEVAVDPEMLGRIFESLLPDNEREKKGTYYTPRPVVQFMCREALVGRLASDELPEPVLRTLISEEEPLPGLRELHSPADVRRWAQYLDARLAGITVLDPAVGSGAFLLGMLGEIIRLRSHAHSALHGRPPGDELVHAWKLHAIERSLFGVDIEPTAVELCRLRLWLSLAVELDASRPVPPLPNLEYRTICADSLVDFVEGIPIQDTRRVAGKQASLFAGPESEEVVKLRAEYFDAADPARKSAIKGWLRDKENLLLEDWLRGAQNELKRNPAAQARLEKLREQLFSPDRDYPVFMPGFSAPDVWRDGGWDVVIMNPPYVGRKEIPQRYPATTVAALEKHYGQTRDLMILFGERALQLARADGVISMIFNDSIFTSADADEFRRLLFDEATVTAIARTKCFEGQAVNGGVTVARLGFQTERPVRWVEGFQRPVEDFAGASAPVPPDTEPGTMVEAGSMEVYVVPREVYLTLPHRPFYRPSSPALTLRETFTRTAWWRDLSKWPMPDEPPLGWRLLSETRALEKEIASRRAAGMYDKLKPGDWSLLGMVTEGGQGLATADDRRFLGAIDGTDAAQDHTAFQTRLEKLTRASPFSGEYESLLKTHGDRERALLALWAVHGAKRPCPLPWPRTGTIRIAAKQSLRSSPLSADERLHGVDGDRYWVLFEKGDQQQEIEGDDGRISRIGSAWIRDNPIVIDWSREAVSILRRRAASKGPQSPRLQNEELWFSAGVTWNRVASYLRVRQLPETAMFGSEAPLLRPLPWIEWMSPNALLALLNSEILDFVLRTFLGSRMHVEVGDVRRLPIPVLAAEQNSTLEDFADKATAAKRTADAGRGGQLLKQVEGELNAFVRDLYGVPRTAELWVVR